ncbi:hypothetical protein EON79_09150 [bacterium]|nr:MAG: hypothetical protein EON79_09150 [bacterium]
MEGAPPGSVAAVRMRAFLFFVALHNGTADSLVPETLDLTRLDRHRDMVALYVLSKKMANQESLSADESIAALLIKGDLSPRTPYHRCHREVMTVYRRLYAERYKKGLMLKPGYGPLHLEYEAANSGIGSALVTTPDLAGYRVAPASGKKVKDLLGLACEALDPYSRRLSTRPEETGKLPAIALCPAEVLGENEVLLALDTLAKESPGGRVPCSAISAHWVGWPDKPLSKAAHEALAKAFWYRGYAMEPNSTGSAPVSPDGAVFVTPRFPQEGMAGSDAYRSSLPMANLAVALLDIDGPVRERLIAVAGLGGSDAARLNAHIDFVSEFGAPKVTKLAFETIPLVFRFPLLTLLAEEMAARGTVGPKETEALLRAAKGLQIPEEEVYPLLHRSASGPASAAPKANKKSGMLDMRAVAEKLASSRAAAEILINVFVEEESVPEPPKPAENGLPDLLREVASRESWSAAEFAELARRYGKMAAGAYDELNEAAYEAVGDPLLEGEDPIRVDPSVAKEMLP